MLVAECSVLDESPLASIKQLASSICPQAVTPELSFSTVAMSHSPATRSHFAALLLAVLALGCASPLTTALNSAATKEPTPTPAETQAAEALKAQALHKATVGEAIPEDKAFAEVLDQLQEIRAIDPEAERELIAELKQVKPENYAMVVDAFRTALAYRQQMAERDRAVFAGETPENEFDVATQQLRTKSPPTTKVQQASATVDVPPTEPPTPAAANWPAAQPTSPNLPAAVPPLSPAASRVVPAAPLVATPPPPQAPQARAVEPAAQGPTPTPRPLPRRVDPPATEPADAAAIASDAQQPPAPVAAPLPVAGDWHAQLAAAIDELEHSVSPQPTTVAELHDHMRLRTLQLLAGNETDAYRPIPGASPAQQDFWSKQLFAINAYLNATTQLDEKQRAVAALAPLDEARARLSELASLRIRNLSFVESVDGFGTYEPSKGSSFAPGQKVMLYAEVENFASSASEEGFATSLGTSFKVLDESNRLVDGKQFPDVHDSCRNRRRDFHMQYELALPERIYPGPYKIELTITDHNSGKIGQTTIPFEITGESTPKPLTAAAPAPPKK
ncbi:hypothetical protein [Lacipirellula limnantheis]|uniref:Uncharacterized protein n=1 Tax=Lacipirellula limnantheis TaxID=2528024 RepID=A0A517U2R1_9BACT|nr:hypothetical protein [Lacipirellula limnantheis]QDT74906.1 hypothetical protein I41_41100 [Lacipirellula limnantheis]